MDGMDGGPMRRDALIRISSTTKPVTATAMLSPIDEAYSTSTRRSKRDYPNTPDAVSCADPTAPHVIPRVVGVGPLLPREQDHGLRTTPWSAAIWSWLMGRPAARRSVAVRMLGSAHADPAANDVRIAP